MKAFLLTNSDKIIFKNNFKFLKSILIDNNRSQFRSKAMYAVKWHLPVGTIRLATIRFLSDDPEPFCQM